MEKAHAKVFVYLTGEIYAIDALTIFYKNSFYKSFSS